MCLLILPKAWLGGELAISYGRIKIVGIFFLERSNREALNEESGMED
jgi:hypothetical protein